MRDGPGTPFTSSVASTAWTFLRSQPAGARAASPSKVFLFGDEFAGTEGAVFGHAGDGHHDLRGERVDDSGDDRVVLDDPGVGLHGVDAPGPGGRMLPVADEHRAVFTFGQVLFKSQRPLVVEG